MNIFYRMDLEIYDSKSDFSPFFFGNVFPYHDDFLMKIKMVRMVIMNIFYRMDLENCDSKSEL